jgi:hypothetical protein
MRLCAPSEPRREDDQEPLLQCVIPTFSRPLESMSEAQRTSRCSFSLTQLFRAGDADAMYRIGPLTLQEMIPFAGVPNPQPGQVLVLLRTVNASGDVGKRIYACVVDSWRGRRYVLLPGPAQPSGVSFAHTSATPSGIVPPNLL